MKMEPGLNREIEMDLPVSGKILFLPPEGNMKKTILLSMILMLAVSPLFSLGLFDKEEPVEEEKETQPTIQDLYSQLVPELPVIGFMEPEVESNIPAEEGIKVWDSFLEEIVKEGVFKPAGFGDWFEQKYSRNLPYDILHIIYDIKRDKLPLDYLGTMKITRSEDQFLVRIGIHSLKTSEDVRYIYRILDDLDESWNYILPDIMNEFNFRSAVSNSPVLDKQIYIEPLKVRYYQYYEIGTGEYAFTEIPFMILGTTDFREDNDILHEMLGMRLHQSGVYPLLFADLNNRCRETGRRRPGATWGVRSELRISDRLSVFRLEIWDYKRQVLVNRYDFPFNGYSTEVLSKLLDMAVPYVLEDTLSAAEKQRVSIVTPSLEEDADRVYTDHGYIGPASLTVSYIMQTGLNKLLFIKDARIPLTKDEEKEAKRNDESLEPRQELAIPDLTSFNVSVLADPSGSHYRIFKERDILYAESIFQD